MSTGFQPFDSPEGGSVRVLTGQLASGQTFVGGDAIGITAGQLVASAGNTALKGSNFVGFSAGPATGYTANTRSNLGRYQPQTEADFGAVEEIGRQFYVPTDDQLFTCRRYYTAEDNSAEADFQPNADMWVAKRIAKPTGAPEWGVCDDVAVLFGAAGTAEIGAIIVGLYDELGQRVLTTAAAITAAMRGPDDIKKPYRFIVKIANPYTSQLGTRGTV